MSLVPYEEGPHVAISVRTTNNFDMFYEIVGKAKRSRNKVLCVSAPVLLNYVPENFYPVVSNENIPEGGSQGYNHESHSHCW